MGLHGRRLAAVCSGLSTSTSSSSTLRAGIIGLDTADAVAITEALSSSRACRVVAAVRRGTGAAMSTNSTAVNHRIIRSSGDQIFPNTERARATGVVIVDSVAELLPLVDCVFLETRDGRPRLEQAAEVLRAGKPLFMDKPVAGNLADALAIYAFAEGLGVPIMSSCPLRFAPVCAAARAGEYGQVLGADVFSPAHLEEEISNVGGFGHVDFYWHAVHGIEALFAAMGRGCTSVSRTTAGRSDVCVARWDDGRTATYRGIHSSPMSRMDVPLPDEPGAYGGTLVTTKGDQTLGNEGLNPRSCLPALLDEVIQFFRSGQPAVTAAETIEMYAFMAACDESKVRGGAEVTLEEVLGPAKQRAQVVLDRHWYKPATYHGRNRLGPPPALAIVNDTRAARVTAEAIIAHHGAGLDQEAVLAEPTLARHGIGVEIDWNGTLSDGPNHPGVPQSWWKSLAAKDAEAHVEEEEAEAAVDSEE